MIKKLLIGMIAMSCAAVGAAPAAAAIMTLTYTGTVYGSSYDYSGDFGPAGGSLTGLSFVQVFRYDTSLGRHTKDLYVETLSSVTPEPMAGTGSLTINGVTRYLGDQPRGFNYTAIVLLGNYLFTSSLFNTYDDTGTWAQMYMNQGQGFPTGIDHNASGVLTAEYGGGLWESISEDLQYSDIYLAPTSFSLTGGISDVSSAPEPASWALMIAGFGLIGLSMRRRRTVLAV